MGRTLRSAPSREGEEDEAPAPDAAFYPSSVSCPTCDSLCVLSCCVLLSQTDEGNAI